MSSKHTLHYASKHVEQRVDIELMGSTRQVAIEYIYILKAVLKSGLVKSLGPINGQLFEKFGHRKFVDEGSVQFEKVGRLKTHEPMSVIKFDPLYHRGVKFFDDHSTVNGKWKDYTIANLSRKTMPLLTHFLFAKIHFTFFR